jgi:glutathione S-transferase
VIKLYYAPRTRAVRVVWLLEELGLPYELVRVPFQPPATKFFVQSSPTGKIPTLEDGDVTMCESGAIVEYLLERYGAGRLAPPVGSPERARFLQWVHFAESTAFPPLGIVVWLVLYRGNSPDEAKLIADARERAAAGFEFLERELSDRTYLLGKDFTAADIMMGFTLVAAQQLGVLTAERFPGLTAYLGRLLQRPALQKTIALN